ncbi:MAG: mechanosensitive ion channel [Alphaproteobacteria bacterium]|nr:mechanosensitive ion channel [Alphaproteobacteria bacterium]
MGDVSGTVEDIGMKTTRLRSLVGEEIIVPNSDLLSGQIHNYRRMNERSSHSASRSIISSPPTK